MIDLTDRVVRIVSQSGILDGCAVIFTPSATSALTTIEYESGALKDLQELLDQLAPRKETTTITPAGRFQRTRTPARSAPGPSLASPSMPQTDAGYLAADPVIDFDNRPRQREIFVQIQVILPELPAPDARR